MVDTAYAVGVVDVRPSWENKDRSKYSNPDAIGHKVIVLHVGKKPNAPRKVFREIISEKRLKLAVRGANPKMKVPKFRYKKSQNVTF